MQKQTVSLEKSIQKKGRKIIEKKISSLVNSWSVEGNRHKNNINQTPNCMFNQRTSKIKTQPNELTQTTIIKKKPPRTKIKYFEKDDNQGWQRMKIIGTERDIKNKANKCWNTRKEEEEED